MLRIRSLLAGLLCTVAVPLSIAATPAPRVQFNTSMGNFVVEVYPDKAPKTVANFLRYVKDGFYPGTLFHRVINGFMIQGGGFTADMQQKATRAPIAIESANGLKNSPYTLAMARTADPDSATAQFYVNVADNRMLDYPGQDGYGYTVFGKVVAGADAIDRIRRADTTTRLGHQNVPVKPIVIDSVTLVSQ